MANVLNVKGTSFPSFGIGKNGITLFQGTIAPNGTNGADGDIYIRASGASSEFYQKIGGAWVALVNANLESLGALTPSSNNIIVGNGTTWTTASGVGARAALGLAIGTDVQAHDLDLDAIASLAHTAGNVIKSNGTTWQSATNTLDDISDVILTGPANNDVLKYNGTNWINGTSASSGGGDPLDTYFNPANTVFNRTDLTTTSVTNAYQYTGTGRALVTSISVANIDGGTAEPLISAFINDNSASTDFYIARKIPVLGDSAIELLKRPKVLEPNDRIKLQTDIANNLQVIVTAAPFGTNATLFNAFLSAGTSAVGTDVTAYTESGTNGSVISSILLTNDQGGTYGAEVSVIMNDGTNNTYLCRTINVPAGATLELCEQPKFLPNTGTIKIRVSDADFCDISIAGRKL